MRFDRLLLVTFERGENIEIEIFFANWMAVCHFLFVMATCSDSSSTANSVSRSRLLNEALSLQFRVGRQFVPLFRCASCLQNRLARRLLAALWAGSRERLSPGGATAVARRSIRGRTALSP